MIWFVAMLASIVLAFYLLPALIGRITVKIYDKLNPPN